jgi:hypothetical protein
LRFWSGNSAGPFAGRARRPPHSGSKLLAQEEAASSGSENSPVACPIWARTGSTLVASGSETGSPRSPRDCSAFGSERGCPAGLRQGTCEAVMAESCYRLLNLSGAPEAVIHNVAAGIFQIPLLISKEAAGLKQILGKLAVSRSANSLAYRDHVATSDPPCSPAARSKDRQVVIPDATQLVHVWRRHRSPQAAPD